MNKRIYEFGYRYSRVPWEVGPREELARLVESRRIAPCRAIDLGCGTGASAVFLAEHGFEVTGVDYAASAIEKARQKANAAGVDVQFVVDDLGRIDRDLYVHQCGAAEPSRQALSAVVLRVVAALVGKIHPLRTGVRARRGPAPLW